MAETYDQAALRHLKDAESLAEQARFDSAGHLVGFAAECAIKFAIASLRPGAEAPHVHFPYLIEAAKKHVHGRRQTSISIILHTPSFMSGWDVNHRYWENGNISKDQYERWRRDASKAVGAAGLRR